VIQTNILPSNNAVFNEGVHYLTVNLNSVSSLKYTYFLTMNSPSRIDGSALDNELQVLGSSMREWRPLLSWFKSRLEPGLDLKAGFSLSRQQTIENFKKNQRKNKNLPSFYSVNFNKY